MLIALQLISIGAKAMTGDKNISFVKTGDKVYFGQDLKRRLYNSKIISSDGAVTKISNRNVIAYMHDSHLFEYLPVISESNDIICYAMMENITNRSGFRLYRYNFYEGTGIKSFYFVFKDGKYYRRIDERNAQTELPFFGIKNVRLSES
jgi:hypothetical protein